LVKKTLTTTPGQNKDSWQKLDHVCESTKAKNESKTKTEMCNLKFWC